MSGAAAQEPRSGSLPLSRLELAQALWGWSPHPTQRQWLLDDSPVKAAACGRRWGKTEAQAVDAATYALMFHGSEQIIVAPTYDQAKLIATGVERFLLMRPATRRFTDVRRTPYPLITVLGSRISARSADDDGRSLRGHRADRVMVDEAAFVRESVISEVVQPMLADTDGQLILISTPYGHNYFWRTWLAGQDPQNARVRSFRFPSGANPHISAKYVQRQRYEIPERAFHAEYLAEFVDDAACVFPWADLQACMALGRDDPLPGERRIVAGVDWARYSDYTACVALDTARVPWRVVASDRFQGLSWEAAVERVAGFLAAHCAAAALCDATSGGDPLLEQMQRKMARTAGWQTEVEGLVFTSGSKREVIDNLAIRLAHREIAFSSAQDVSESALMRELEAYEYRLTSAGSVTYAAPAGRHDDCVIALALAAWQAKAAPEFRIHLSSGRDGRSPGW